MADQKFRTLFEFVIGETSASVEQLTKVEDGLKRMRKELRTLKSERDKLNDLVAPNKDEINRLEEVNKEIKLLATQEKLAAEQARQLRRDTKLLTREAIALDKGLPVDSFEVLRISSIKLTKEYDKLSRAQRTNSKEGRKIKKELAAINEEIREGGVEVNNFRANVGNYTQSFKRAGLSIAAAFGLTGGISTVAQNIANITKESVQLANEAKGIDFAFNRIDNSIAILDRAKESTQGLLSDLDIKKSIVEFDNFGIELEQLPELLEFVSVRAAQTGKSFDTLRDSLIEGLSKESKLRIDNLGISTQELNDELEKTPNFVQAVGNIAKREIAEAGDVINEADKAQQRFNATTENAQVLLGQLINKGLKPAIGSLGNFIELISNGLFGEELSDSLREEQLGLNLLVTELNSANVSQERRNSLIKTIKDNYPEYNALIDVETASNGELAFALKQINEEYINRIVLQKEVEKGEAIANRAASQQSTVIDLQRELFQKLNSAVIDYGLQTEVTFSEVEQSAKNVLSALNDEDLNFFQRNFGTPDEIEDILNNIELIGGFANQSAAEYSEQVNAVEILKIQLGLVTEQEREYSKVQQERLDAYNKRFGTQLTALNDEQNKQLDAAIAKEKRLSKQRDKDVEKQLTGLKKLETELSKLNSELQSTEGENAIRNKLIEITNKQAEVDKLKATINEIRSGLNTPLDVGTTTADSGISSFGAPVSGERSVDEDPLTFERIFLEERAELRNKFNLEDLKEREKFEKELKELGIQQDLRKLDAQLINFQGTTEQRLTLEEEIASKELELLDSKNAKRLEKTEQQAALENEIKQAAISAGFELVKGLIDNAFNAEIEATRRASDRRIDILKGEYEVRKNAAEGNKELQTQIELERVQKEKEIRKQQFQEEKRLKKQQALAAGALAIIQAFAQLGPIGGAIAAAVVAVTTAIQIDQINKTKFAKGGFTGVGYGAPDDTGHKPAGIVHADEYVSTKKQVVKYPELFNFLEKDRLGKYARGGFTGTNAPQVIGTSNFNSGPSISIIAPENMIEFAELVAPILAAQTAEATGDATYKGTFQAQNETLREAERQGELEASTNI